MAAMSGASGHSRAFSGEVDTGWREENASKQEIEPVPIQSERKRLWSGSRCNETSGRAFPWLFFMQKSETNELRSFLNRAEIRP
jgi:hypothetical protein